jgi:GT2 family glycosyltransferase
VAVIIVLHNSADHLEACLRSVPPDAHIVIVDNASEDGWEAIVNQTRPSATILRHANIGFGAACNAGARSSSEPVLAFLNPDAEIELGSLDRLLARASARPGFIAGPALLAADGTLRLNCRKASHWSQDAADLLPYAKQWLPTSLRRDLPADDPIYDHGGIVAYLQGACLVLPRQAFELVGGFDERFFLYAEEEDLCARLAARGVSSFYEPRAIVRHLEGTSMAKTSLFAKRHRYRSMILLYDTRGFGGACAAAVVVLCALLIQTTEHLLRRWARRQLWSSAAERRAVARGIVEGLIVACSYHLGLRD